MSELIQIGAQNQRPKPPKRDDLELKFSEQAAKELDALRAHYPEEKACILPALWIAQREYGGYLSGEAIAEVAVRLNRSYAEIEGVATFYSMYNTAHRPGRHKIEVCTCLSCHVCGAYRIWDHLRAKLGIGHGETTEDGVFTLEEVECLDACDRAPVLQVGDRYIGPVTEADVDRLLDELRANPNSTVIQMANEIVKTQVSGPEWQAVHGG